jgi:hypothetical protein
LINAEASGKPFEEVVVDAVERGIPIEIVARLQELWDVTKDVGGELVEIGKIIVREIVAFLKAHPKLTSGLAIAAAVTFLVGAIPFLGPLLQPLVLALGMLVMGGTGAVLDEGTQPIAPLTVAIALAQVFFDLMVNIFVALKAYWLA